MSDLFQTDQTEWILEHGYCLTELPKIPDARPTHFRAFGIILLERKKTPNGFISRGHSFTIHRTTRYLPPRHPRKNTTDHCSA